jgi:hypothetical protein
MHVAHFKPALTTLYSEVELPYFTTFHLLSVFLPIFVQHASFMIQFNQGINSQGLFPQCGMLFKKKLTNHPTKE